MESAAWGLGFPGSRPGTMLGTKVMTQARRNSECGGCMVVELVRCRCRSSQYGGCTHSPRIL